jgi:hypothetical protein
MQWEKELVCTIFTRKEFMNYLIAILEYDEYNKNNFSEFCEDESLIEVCGDVFYGYIDNPSDFSQIYFSTGPYSENCIVVFYKEIGENDELDETDADSFFNVISDLKRNGYLFICHEQDFKLLQDKMNDAFPIEDFDASCVSKAEFE